jgi:protein-disulfide isomerase
VTVQYPKGRAAKKAPRTSRLPATRWLIAGALGIACLVAAALILASVLGSDDAVSATETYPTNGTKVFQGIPQEATLLGRHDAPVTLVEYADLQCPFCRDFALGTVPALVREYVRSGKVRIELRPLTFISQQSELGQRAVVAAALQNKAWNMAEVLYENQGEENKGWLNEQLIRNAAGSVPGLDAGKLMKDLNSAGVDDIIGALQATADRDQVHQTPYFLLGKSGDAKGPLRVTSLEPEAFRPAIDALLKTSSK